MTAVAVRNRRDRCRVLPSSAIYTLHTSPLALHTSCFLLTTLHCILPLAYHLASTRITVTTTLPHSVYTHTPFATPNRTRTANAVCAQRVCRAAARAARTHLSFGYVNWISNRISCRGSSTHMTHKHCGHRCRCRIALTVLNCSPAIACCNTAGTPRAPRTPAVRATRLSLDVNRCNVMNSSLCYLLNIMNNLLNNTATLRSPPLDLALPVFLLVYISSLSLAHKTSLILSSISPFYNHSLCLSALDTCCACHPHVYTAAHHSPAIPSADVPAAALYLPPTSSPPFGACHSCLFLFLLCPLSLRTVCLALARLSTLFSPAALSPIHLFSPPSLPACYISPRHLYNSMYRTARCVTASTCYTYLRLL